MGNDLRDFDMVIGLADELRRFQKEGAAMLAGAREYIPLRRRIGMKRAVRAGVRLAPLSLGRLAFLARGLVSLARRCVGIFGRLRRQIEFGTKCRVVGAQCSTSLVKRSIASACEKNEADKRFLISESSVSRSIYSFLSRFRCQTFSATPTSAQFQLRPE